MAVGIETTLTNISTLLETIAPTLSIILIILSGIVYGLAQSQPPEVRGKWQNTAISIFVGGVIVAAIAGAATLISSEAGKSLQ
ncbi:MAG: hypothetical protein Q7S22_08575 [Candidatus Micrarchaeota archaeon]|nr:hypothetical protein [Candidatus Micrarchaeota archaeon]